MLSGVCCCLGGLVPRCSCSSASWRVSTSPTRDTAIAAEVELSGATDIGVGWRKKRDNMNQSTISVCNFTEAWKAPFHSNDGPCVDSRADDIHPPAGMADFKYRFRSSPPRIWNLPLEAMMPVWGGSLFLQLRSDDDYPRNWLNLQITIILDSALETSDQRRQRLFQLSHRFAPRLIRPNCSSAFNARPDHRTLRPPQDLLLPPS